MALVRRNYPFREAVYFDPLSGQSYRPWHSVYIQFANSPDLQLWTSDLGPKYNVVHSREHGDMFRGVFDAMKLQFVPPIDTVISVGEMWVVALRESDSAYSASSGISAVRACGFATVAAAVGCRRRWRLWSERASSILAKLEEASAAPAYSGLASFLRRLDVAVAEDAVLQFLESPEVSD